MKVFLRIRPFIGHETVPNQDQKCMEVSEDGHVLTLHAPKDSNKFKTSVHGVGDKIQSFFLQKYFRRIPVKNSFLI
ncbi:kinesin-like protein KIF20A [Clavelina lepadiformis]|uniref:kinesin-like protein KIF20A n=1 Tax=Clavelina lepadiformis TaxID=159417 RepID=UPI004042C236